MLDTRIRSTRIQTNIEGLDEKLGGGFPEGSAILLLSNSEMCLRTFFQQVSFNLVSKGRRVFYLTITREPSFIIEEMKIYEWNIDSPKISPRWFFVDAFTTKFDVNVNRVNSNIKLPFDLLVRIRNDILTNLKEGDIVIIDLLSDLLLKYDPLTIIDFLEMFIAIIRKIKGLIVMPVVKQMHDTKTLSIVSHFADGVIELEIDEMLFNGRIRFWQMRRTILEPFFLPISLTEKGINVETFERIV